MTCVKFLDSLFSDFVGFMFKRFNLLKGTLSISSEKTFLKFYGGLEERAACLSSRSKKIAPLGKKYLNILKYIFLCLLF